MLEKGKIYEAVIADYTSEGQGVAKIEGCAVFVPNAIVGERCEIRIEKAQKTWAAEVCTGKCICCKKYYYRQYSCKSFHDSFIYL